MSENRTLEPLPDNAKEFMDWPWDRIEPHFQKLADTEVTQENIATWMSEWSRLTALIDERSSRIYVAITVDTGDAEAEAAHNRFLDEILPHAMTWDQKLKEQVLATGLTMPGMELQFRKLRTEAEIFCKENVPLVAQERKVSTEYDKITGSQTIEFDGEEKTLTQLAPVYQETDRGRREQAFRLAMGRGLQDREALNELYARLLKMRLQMAENAGFDNYIDFRWKAMLRFDYSPDDCRLFHDAIEEAVVPAAGRIYEKRRKALGVEKLRPWDLDVDELSRNALRPFSDTNVLIRKTADVFRRLHPTTAAYFRHMVDHDLLDLDNRKGKAPGGYCINFEVEGVPFIFMNATGVHRDVQTLLHESGHSFHTFQANKLPLLFQREVGMEFAEVASMSMELLAAPYLSGGDDPFYSREEAARARIQHLEKNILFWPYMAVVDGFQHWVYANPDESIDAKNCDAKWSQLWDRFMPGVDWTGFEDAKATGWHRKLHIFHIPFYYVEYGLAQLGAVQVWKHSLEDEEAAVRDYLAALELGGTADLPGLFSAAGARFAFDASVLRESVELMEKTIDELENV